MAAFRAGMFVGALAIGMTWIAVATPMHGDFVNAVHWIALGFFWFGIMLLLLGEPRGR